MTTHLLTLLCDPTGSASGGDIFSKMKGAAE